MNFPPVSKTDPNCDACLDKYKEHINKIIEINRLIIKLQTDIQNQNLFCKECCDNKKESMCFGITQVNIEMSKLVSHAQQDLIKMYREIKKVYLPQIPVSK